MTIIDNCTVHCVQENALFQILYAYNFMQNCEYMYKRAQIQICFAHAHKVSPARRFAQGNGSAKEYTGIAGRLSAEYWDKRPAISCTTIFVCKSLHT